MRLKSRRDFMRSTAAFAGVVPWIGLARWQQNEADTTFRHGVASGDPLSDRVLLWTRVSTSRPVVDVRWAVATDPAMKSIVARGEGPTAAARDHTVKVDVTGLLPATTYYYRFETDAAQSPVGRTRTLAGAPASRVRLGVVSCSNYPFGYFNAYGALAKRRDLDAVVHLGDYIYEYANRDYGDGTPLGRVPSPDKETIALEDYRQRHAQYKTDPDLQEVHRQHSFIVLWDDHELANNAWHSGAQNHNPTDGDGDWFARRNAAVQAFFEWMPIREDARALSPRIYRTLRFGDLMDLVLLDTRLVGRDEQAPSREDVAVIDAPSRSLLGAAQEAWLHGELAESKRRDVTWQVLGQQVMFALQTERGKPARSVDTWDGYRACRDRVFDMFAGLKLENVAILTGDSHTNWAFDVPRDPFGGFDRSIGRGSVAVELAGTSVTSPSGYGANPDGEKRRADVLASQPHLHYADGRHRGYFVLDITRERLQADYFGMATIETRATEESFLKGFAAPRGQMHLTEQSSPVPPLANPAALA
jgi:alkaline phosphatase D